jgi:sugar O-acyltransferase (sialic acid O-acetyltransferase NeuD family)
VVADTALESGRWERIAFLDDALAEGATVLGLPVLGSVPEIDKLAVEYPDCLVAIGVNARRRALLATMRQAGYALPSLIHPHAQVSRWTSIGEGSVIMAGAVVQAECRIGEGVIVNTGASIDHDCVIGDAAHICPGVHLAGAVVVGNEAWIGIGSTVREGVGIGARATIGAGACVLSDVPADTVAVGVPAKPQ